jgi:hypothetical protein
MGLGSVAVSLTVTACGGTGDGSGQCSDVHCGGDIVGTWAVQSVCVDEQEFAAQLMAELPAECSNLLAGADANADIVSTFNADGSRSDAGSVQFSVTYDYTDSCLEAQAGQSLELTNELCQMIADAASEGVDEEIDEPGLTNTLSCSLLGGACRCTAETSMQVDEVGTYTVSGFQLTDEDGDTVNFCVQGDTLTVSGGTDVPGVSYTARRQ